MLNQDELNRLASISKINIFTEILTVIEFNQDELYYFTPIPKINIFMKIFISE